MSASRTCKRHEIQLAPDDPVDNELTDLYYYVIPRTKANFSVAWTLDKFTATLFGTRIGGLPNYDGTERLGPTFMYNGSVNYRFNDHWQASLVVDNLKDSKPGRDSTWTSYPYYTRAWFSPVGRAYFVEVTATASAASRKPRKPEGLAHARGLSRVIFRPVVRIT